MGTREVIYTTGASMMLILITRQKPGRDSTLSERKYSARGLNWALASREIDDLEGE